MQKLINGSEEGFKFPKKELKKLFKTLSSYGEVIGPVHDGTRLRMEPVEDPEKVTFEGISWFTSKKYLFPEKQTLFKFNGTKLERVEDYPKRVLFGMRLCDLNAISVNDNLFLHQSPPNRNYENFRKNLTLVGLWCDTQQDKYCFCDSMDLKHFYDICLFDKGDYFHIKTGSKKGEEIIKKLKIEDKKEKYFRDFPDCDMKLSTKDIKRFFERNEMWQKGANDCLSCGDCTTLCPTCLCFDVKDEMEIDLKSGKREVKWDSCMYRDFTLVAGNHVYRNTRLNRFKHRIYHKLDYFPEKFEQYMCTGCGRCIRGCPTKIDWVSIINEMAEEEKQNG